MYNMEKRKTIQRFFAAGLFLFLLVLVLGFWAFLHFVLKNEARNNASRNLAALINQAEEMVDNLDLEISLNGAFFSKIIADRGDLTSSRVELSELSAIVPDEYLWPSVIKAISIIDAGEPWTPDREMTMSRVINIVHYFLPGLPPQSSFRVFIALLDEEFLCENAIPDLAAIYFGKDSGFSEYKITVRDGFGKIRYTNTDKTERMPDFTIPLFREAGAFDAARSYTAFLPRPGRSRQESGRDEKYSAWYMEIRRSGLGILPAENRKTFIMSMAALGLLSVLYGSLVALYASFQHTRDLVMKERAFIASVSHELKTPIAVTLSAAENLTKGIVPAERVAEYGEVIAREARRLGSSVDSILTLAGLKSLAELKGREAVDINQAISTVLMRLEHYANEQGSSFEIVAEGRPLAHALPVLLESAIESIIGNAIKYAPGLTEIKTGSRKRSGKSLVYIQVVDRGPGISRQERRKIFEPFWRGQKASEMVEGTGVGLYLARRIARMHGGDLRLIASSSAGSVFELSFRSYI